MKVKWLRVLSLVFLVVGIIDNSSYTQTEELGKVEPITRELLEDEERVEKKLSQNIKIEQKGKDIYNIELRNAELTDVIRFFAYRYGLNIIADKEVEGKVSASFGNISLKEALRQILDSQGYKMTEVDNVIRVKKKPTPTVTFTLKNVSVNDVLENVTSLLSEGGKLVVDELSNSIMVADEEANLDMIKEFIKNVDVKGKQVLIEAKFVETTLGATQNLGIDWTVAMTATGSKRPHTFPFKKTGEESLFPDVDTSSTTFSSGTGFPVTDESNYVFGTLDFSQFQTVLKALLTNTDSKVISNPQVATLNNKKAEISLSTEYPLPTYQIDSNTGLLVVSGYEYKDVGIILNVTPLISSDDYITMIIEPTVGEVSDTVTAGVSDLPVIKSKKATTRVTVKDGETIVIGGLISEDDTKTIKRVPFLGDIPIFGKLFSYKTSDETRSELLIFVTPHILSLEGKEKKEEEKITELYQEAESYLAQGKYEEAIAKAEGILNLNPEEDKARDLIQKASNEINRLKLKEEINSKLAQVKKLLEEKKYALAKSVLEWIVKNDPENVEAQHYLELSKRGLEEESRLKSLWKEANRLYSQRDYQAAGEKYEEILALVPENEDAMEMLKRCKQKIEEFRRERISSLLREGRKFLKERRYEKAIEAFRKVLEIEPGQKEAQERILEAEREIERRYEEIEQAIDKGRYEEALAKAKEMLKRKPEDARAEKLLKEAYLGIEAEKARQAREEIERRLKEAIRLYQQGKYRLAKLILEEVLEKDPENQQAKEYLSLSQQSLELQEKIATLREEADAFYAQAKYQLAQDKYSQIISLAPEDKYALKMFNKSKQALLRIREKKIAKLLQEGKRAFRKKEYNQALNYFNSILELDSENEQANTYISKVKAKLEEEKRTKELAEGKGKEVTNHKREVESLDVLLAKAKNLFEKGNYQEAQALFKKILEQDPAREEARKYLQLSEEKIAQARLTEEKRIEEKEEIKALLQQALDRYEKERYQEAVAILEKILLKEPNNQQAYRYLEKSHQKIEELERQKKRGEIEALIQEGKFYLREGKYDSAFQSFYRVLEIEPQNRSAKRYLNLLKKKISEIKRQEAKKLTRELSRKKSEWVKVELKKAELYLQEGEIEKAKQVVSKVLQEQESREAREILAKIERREETRPLKETRSVPEEKKGIKTSSRKAKAIYREATKLYKAGKYQQALEKLELLSDTPYRKKAQALASKCLQELEKISRNKLIEEKYRVALEYFDMGLYEDSIGLLKEVVDLKPGYKEAQKYLKLAQQRLKILENLGEFEQVEMEVGDEI